MKDFEKSLKEIKKIVEKLEDGNQSLDVSIKNFEKGAELIKECYERLNEVKKKIKIVVENSEGIISEEDFNIEEE